MADKKRKQNWSDMECELLSDQCVTNMNVIMGKFSTSIKSSSKKEFWQNTCDTINACGGSNRTVPEIMKKWADMKSKAKQAEQKRRALMRKTGGGSAPPMLTPLEEKIISIFPKEILEGVSFGEDTFVSESECSNPVAGPSVLTDVNQERAESVTVYCQLEEDKENVSLAEQDAETQIKKQAVHKRSKSQADECRDLLAVEREILEESRKRNIILGQISEKMDDIIRLKKRKIELLEKLYTIPNNAVMHDLFFEP